MTTETLMDVFENYLTDHVCDCMSDLGYSKEYIEDHGLKIVHQLSQLFFEAFDEDVAQTIESYTSDNLTYLEA